MTKLPNTSKATVESLEARRTEQERHIASLRAEHTRSIIDGTDFDASPIRAAEDELAAIMTAKQTLIELEKEYQRQEAEALEKLTDEEKRKRIAARLKELEGQWLSEVENCESAARDFAAAYHRAVDATKLLHIGLLSQGTRSMGLMSAGFETRVSEGLSALLSKTTGQGNLGRLKLPAVVRSADLPWVDAEHSTRRDVDAAIEALSGEIGGPEAA